MKPAEMRSLTEDQLTKLETDLYVEWRNLRFQEAVGQLTNNARIHRSAKTLPEFRPFATSACSMRNSAAKRHI